MESLSGLSPLTVEEIQQAERTVIRYVQLQAYDKEFKLMKSSECEVRKKIDTVIYVDWNHSCQLMVSFVSVEDCEKLRFLKKQNIR